MTQAQRSKKREIDKLKHRSNRAEHKARLDSIEQDVAHLRSTIAELTIHIRRLTYPAARLELDTEDADAEDASTDGSITESITDGTDSDELMVYEPATMTRHASSRGWSSAYRTLIEGSSSVRHLCPGHPE